MFTVAAFDMRHHRCIFFTWQDIGMSDVPASEGSRDVTQPSLLRLATEALSTITTTAASDSEDVSSTLKSVRNDEARGELEVAPRADKAKTATSRLQKRESASYTQNMDC